MHALYWLPIYSKVTASLMWFVTRGEALFSSSRQEKALTGAWTKVEIEYGILTGFSSELESRAQAQFPHISTDNDKAQRGCLEQTLGFTVSLDWHKLSLHAQS